MEGERGRKREARCARACAVQRVLTACSWPSPVCGNCESPFSAKCATAAVARPPGSPAPSMNGGV